VTFSCSILLPTDVNHRAIRLNEIRRVDAVAGLFLVDDIHKELLDVPVRRPIADQVPHVMLLHREQARPNPTIRSQANPAALATEGKRHRSDNPDLSLTIRKPVA
jgi:hypothetical protein